MLTSMEALQKIWRGQQAAATCSVDDHPEEAENEVRVKAYLRSLQGQDISQVASKREDSSEPKMRLEDIEEVVRSRSSMPRFR